MKIYIYNAGKLKFLWAMYFMAMMFLNTLASYFIYGEREFSIVTIWQILGMSLVFSILHSITFLKINAFLRTALHLMLIYLTVILFSVFCGWGFFEGIHDFGQFTLVFAVIYAAIYFGFTIYYKSEEAYLNKQLNEYKENK